MAHDIFVSYSQKDKTTADAIVARLEQDGSRCWIAPRDILPGTSWGEAIVDAIAASRVMVLVLSADSNRSRQVVREVQRAVAEDVIILPFRIDPADPTGAMAYFLGTEHWLDALTPPLERHVERLSRTARLLIAREPVPREELDAPPATLGRPRRRPWRMAALGAAVIVAGGAILAVALGSPGGPASPSPAPSIPAPRVALAEVGRFRPLDLDPTDLAVPGPITGFDIHGTWLAYANGPDGVTRMSIAEAAVPRPVDTFAVHGASSVAFLDDQLAAIRGDEVTPGVTIFPVDGSGGARVPIETAGYAELSDIDARDGFVWVAGQGLVAGIDATDPAAPRVVLNWIPPGTTGNPPGVHATDDTLYVTAGWDGLYLFSIADRAAPSLLGHWVSPDWVIDIAVVGSIAYVTLGDLGVAALDVADPTAPTLLGSVTVPGFASPIDVADGHAYVGWLSGTGSLFGVAVVDVTDPAAPELVESFGRFTELSDLQVAGDHLYVSDEGDGLVVFEITTTS